MSTVSSMIWRAKGRAIDAMQRAWLRHDYVLAARYTECVLRLSRAHRVALAAQYRMRPIIAREICS